MNRSTSRVEVRALDRPEAVVTYPMGETQQVRLGGTVISRIVLQPGWKWLEHAQPLVGTASCELYHRGVVLSGWLGIRTDAGEEVLQARISAGARSSLRLCLDRRQPRARGAPAGELPKRRLRRRVQFGGVRHQRQAGISG
jgi:hypothetical protein